MKKSKLFLVAVIVILLGIFSVSALSISTIEVDLSSLTDEEISALFEKVQSEMVNRGIGKTAIFGRGKHMVGEGQQIPVGSYVIKSLAVGEEYGVILVRTPDEPLSEIPSKLWEFVDASTTYKGYLVLEEGDIIDSPCTFTLTISVPAGVFQ